MHSFNLSRKAEESLAYSIHWFSSSANRKLPPTLGILKYSSFSRGVSVTKWFINNSIRLEYTRQASFSGDSFLLYRPTFGACWKLLRQIGPGRLRCRKYIRYWYLPANGIWDCHYWWNTADKLSHAECYPLILPVSQRSRLNWIGVPEPYHSDNACILIRRTAKSLVCGFRFWHSNKYLWWIGFWITQNNIAVLEPLVWGTFRVNPAKTRGYLKN